MKKIIFYLNAVLILASACYSLYGNDRIAEPKKDNVVSATEKKDRENGSRKRPFMRSGEHRKRPQGRYMRGPGIT